MKKTIISLGLLLTLASSQMAFSEETKVVKPKKTKALELTVLHINDHHSHLESDKMSLTLDGKATTVNVGGMTRMAEEIARLKKVSKNPLVLHAGDAMTGTLYYTLFEGVADAKLMNKIKFDATTLGNHEFDGGNRVLKKYLTELDVPVVSANVTPDETSELKGEWTPYIIKEIGGEKVGIIGLVVVGKTVASSNPGKDLKFEEERTATKKAVEELTAKGINKIILLSHAGYDMNVEIAKEVSGIDLIVSGDTHYLLGSQFKEIGWNPVADYPTQITSKDGNPVYILEAYNYNYVLGNTKVKFDAYGIIKKIEGTPEVIIGDNLFQRKGADKKDYILEGAEKESLMKYIATKNFIKVVPENAEAKEILSTYQKEKVELGKQIVGKVEVVVPGGSENRIPNAVNPNGSYAASLVTEAFLYKLQTMGTGDVDMFLQNAGGVRTAIPAGEFSYDTGYNLLPFANTFYVFSMSGAEIKQVMEEAIEYSTKEGGSTGGFPYGAGIRYEAKKSGELGTRVTKVEVKDRITGEWKPLDLAKTYKIGTNSYLAGGKDGWVTFGKIKDTRGGTDTYIDYAKAFIDYVADKKSITIPTTTNVKYDFNK